MTSPLGFSSWNNHPTISTFDDNIGINIGALLGGVSPNAAAYPAANYLILTPFLLQENSTIQRIFVANGGTVSGNIDVGVYTQTFSLIARSGQNLQSGTSILQFFDVPDFSIGPGRYYLAVSMDNNTGQLVRGNIGINNGVVIGMLKQASVFPLPPIVTAPASIDVSYVPLMGLELVRAL